MAHRGYKELPDSVVKREMRAYMGCMDYTATKEMLVLLGDVVTKEMLVLLDSVV